MSEQPEDRKPDLSNFPRGAISIKGLPVSRNARLPSIRIPRDLTLGAQPKRTFKPNIPVRREKRTVEPKVEIQPETSSKVECKPSPSKGKGRGKGRGRELIQLEGGLFEMGIAAVAKDKSKDPSFSRSGFSSGRASSGKKGKADTRVIEENHDLDTLLRDDFIDDGSDEDEKQDLCPVIYPYVEKEKEATPKVKKENLDQDFNNENFAKDLGFDVHKISKFIKKEKTDEEVTETPTETENTDLPDNPISILFKNREELLLKLPKFFSMHYQPPSAESNASSTKNDPSTLPDGKIGKIQVLKSGKIRLVVGSHHYPLDYVKKLPTEHKLYSIETDTDSGDMCHIGNPTTLLSFSPDVEGGLAALQIKNNT